MSLLRRAVLSGVAITAVVLSGSPPAIAAPAGTAAATGTVTGRLTSSTGAGVPDASVEIFDSEDYHNAGDATTEADGTYTITDVPPGTYLVGFSHGGTAPQYHPQKWELWDALPITVADGATVTVDERLVAKGVFTGQIRTATGDPATDLLVDANDEESGAWAQGWTDSEGRYRFEAPVGRYRLSFRPVQTSMQEQFVPGKVDPAEATLFDVRADAETVVDDTVLPVGSLTVKFTDQAGTPMRDVYVMVDSANGHYVEGGRTNANGVFRMPELLAGTYRLGFMIGDDQIQYFRGKLAAEDAEPVVIRGGESTQITEKQLATGSIRITALDAVTGAPIANFCVWSECSAGSGTVTLDLPKGRHDLFVWTSDGSYHSKDVTGVWVGAGQTTERTVKLRPAAVIATTVVDRATGQPVADVCVVAFRPKRVYLPDGFGECSDSQGRIRLGRLETGEYRVFVQPESRAYGRQWLGADGGTGDEREAVLVAATAGETVAAPQIKLDRAGTITGRVTDAATGRPIADAGVSVFTGHPGVGATDAVTDADGRYTLERMGPYQWPVVTQAEGFASQWSGGAASRYTATPVTVTAGSSATHDVALGRGSEVTGTITNADGTPFEYARVIAYNAETGDIAGFVDIASQDRYQMRVTGRQRVYFTYEVSVGEESHDGKYTVTNPDGTTTVPRFTVPATGTLTVDLTIPIS